MYFLKIWNLTRLILIWHPLKNHVRYYQNHQADGYTRKGVNYWLYDQGEYCFSSSISSFFVIFFLLLSFVLFFYLLFYLIPRYSVLLFFFFFFVIFIFSMIKVKKERVKSQCNGMLVGFKLNQQHQSKYW